MLTTSTHDTKRSEDVRARINVLSEMPNEWEETTTRWRDMNAIHKTVVDGNPAPDLNDEWMFYQNLLGVWPTEPITDEFRERMVAYMLKATLESKRHTSWLNPHEPYDHAVREFVWKVLSDERFVEDADSLAERMTFYGYFNSLSQLVLKLTSPGVPDVYQGNELWDFSLVDPDNRRPVDYELRQSILSKLESGVDVADLLSQIEDGAIKLYTTWKTLSLRCDHDVLFRDGEYQDLHVHGSQSHYVCAFARHHDRTSMIVVVPRLVHSLTNGERRSPIGDVWTDTTLTLPTGTYRNLFTAETVEGNEVAMSEVLKTFPIAILVRE